MRVDKLQEWVTDHFCFCVRTRNQKCNRGYKFSRMKSGGGIFILIVLSILCNNFVLIQSLAVTTAKSPVGSGFIRGFFGLSSNESSSSTSLPYTVSSPTTSSSSSASPPSTSTLSYIFRSEKSSSSLFSTTTTPTPASYVYSTVPKPTVRSKSGKSGKVSTRKVDPSSASAPFFFSEEDRNKLMQFLPESLLLQRYSENGRKEIRERARFLVGSLSRQNCFSKVICGLGARPPSTKTDLLNDYVYLMNDLLTDDEKSTEEPKVASPTTSTKFRDDSSASSQQETKKTKGNDKKNRPFTMKDDSDEDLLEAWSNDYDPVLSQLVDEELVQEDPAIMKYMEAEMKKRLKNGPPPGMMMGPPPPPPPYMYNKKMRPRPPRFKRSLKKGNKVENKGSQNKNVTSETQGRSFKGSSKSRRRKAQSRFQQGRFFREPPMNYHDAAQFISKRKLELKNEKDFKKRLSLAADAGRTLRNSRQCRLLFDDCPLNSQQIDSIVVGLRRVMEAGNLQAIIPPTTTLAPEAQAVVDAVKKTVASTTPASHTVAGQPGSKVEIILHLNQNGMPYATQAGTYPAYLHPQVAQTSSNGSTPTQLPPPPLPYIPSPVGGQAQMPMYHPEMFTTTTTTTTTQKPVGEEQLLDFLYGVVNFNSTSESPLFDFDWSGTGSSQIKPLKESKQKNKLSSLDLSEYLETPLRVKDNEQKIYARDPIFDNSAEDSDNKGGGLLGNVLGQASEAEELNALKDYLASLKETLVGLAQMNNASLAVEADIFAKSSEESKESELTKESDDDSEYFEISAGNKNKEDSSEEEELTEDKEVRLKLKGKKKKKKKITTTTERSEPPVDDEKDKEEETSDKIFDDDDVDNRVPSTKKPGRRPPPPRRPQRPGAAKRPPGRNPNTEQKKKKKPVDDEDEVDEIPVEELINGDGDDEDNDVEEDEDEEDEEDEEDYENDDINNNDETDEEEEEEEEADEEEEEEEEEGRSKDKETVLGSGGGTLGSIHSSLLKNPPKADPTKITLVFAPSGTGEDKLADLQGNDEMTSEEKTKLAALTEVLLPTAPAPPPLSPKKPIEDPDDKPVVPAAPPVHREFQKMASFVNNTRIVNMREFDENNPTHPKFHKKNKKRPSYRNPAAKKKKAQAIIKAQAQLAAAQNRRPLGRPIGGPQGPNLIRPPPFRRPPQNQNGGKSKEDEAQDDVGVSGEDDVDRSGSGEDHPQDDGQSVEHPELPGPSLEEGIHPGPRPSLEDDDRPHYDERPPSGETSSSEEREGEEDDDGGGEDTNDDDEPADDEKAADDDADKKKQQDSGADDEDEERPEAEIEFGPGRVPLPGPGPPGIGRLPPKSRDGMDNENDKKQELTKTLIAVPYFREGTETHHVEGPPPPGGPTSVGNQFGKFFVNIMGMKEVSTSTNKPDIDYPPYFGIPPESRNRQKPLSVSYEDKDTNMSIERKSVEVAVNDSDVKPTKLDIAAAGPADDEDDVPPKEFKATIVVDTMKGDTGDLDDYPAWDEPQDDKKGKKKKGKDKDKDKKKKKKKGKKKGKKKATAVISQMHWKAGTPSLFIEGGGVPDGLFNQFKQYVAETVGTMLYLPPVEKANVPPVILSDLPPDESHTVQPVAPPAVPHFNVPIPWDDDDDDDSDECDKGKGKGKKKKKKKKGREGRKKKKKKKKKDKEESCEASSEEDWDDDDDDDKKDKDKDKKDGDKKDGGKKKDGEERDDLIALSQLIEKVNSGKLVINPSISPKEDVYQYQYQNQNQWDTSSTTENTNSNTLFNRNGVFKSTIAPRPTKYKITKRPRTPKPQTARPLFTASFDGVSGNQTLYYRPPPTPPMEKPSVKVEGNIGVPIELFTVSTTTARTTTPRLDLTTLKDYVAPRPTPKRKLQYKNPNKRQKNSAQRPHRWPMIGTVHISQLKLKQHTTLPPAHKEDDEHEPESVHFQPMPGGHYIKNERPPDINKFHSISAEMFTKDDDYYYGEDGSESGERQLRRPLIDLDKLLPWRKKNKASSESSSSSITSHRPASNSYLLGDKDKEQSHERVPSRDDVEENEGSTSTSHRRGNKKGRKKGKPHPHHHHHHHHHHHQSTKAHPHSHHKHTSHEAHNHHHHHQAGKPPQIPPPGAPPQTTGLAAIKNFNIRNLLSKFGNSLLDKAIGSTSNTGSGNTKGRR